MAYDLDDIKDAYEYDTNGWQDIRAEAKLDMQFVGGNPWSKADEDARKDRPTVAPEEMSQYRNQVINALMASPRGAKFAPVGNGANDKGAEFYQNKWREVEYRSHATQHYLNAADNALQRSYGFVRVNTGYASPRSPNQEISIEGFPNPDMVLPDWDALRLDSADMKRCVVKLWLPQKQFVREHPKAKVTNFGDYRTTAKDWIKGDRVLLAEHWCIQTRPRKLVLVTIPPPQAPMRQIAPMGAPAQELPVFVDELDQLKARYPGVAVSRELRDVDYPEVWMYLTNGVELLHQQKWAGKYIPIVSCYGKVLYTEGDEGLERTILSMTRFGRDPWKCYCYACSQELEVLAMVPKAPFMIARGQMNPTELDNVKRSMHEPIAALTYDPFAGLNGAAQPLPPPQPVEYQTGQHLQSLEMVKEGFRRAIQASMGSNFLPTQAQRHNEKSGVALDKIDQVASQGTYHFVYAYESLIRQVGIIGEDLMDKIYDYRGETGVLAPDLKASTIHINNPDQQDAITTKGDYLVTVATAPSSDSQRDAADAFTDQLVTNLQMIAGVAGPKVAAAVLARAIRMRNLGPQGDQLADLIEPPEFKTKDGEPPPPGMMALQAQVQHLTQLLQQAAQEKDAKVVEQQGKFAIEKMKVDATSQDKAADRETKMVVAELGATIDRMALLFEASRAVGVRLDNIEARLHDATENRRNRSHDAVEAARGRIHERLTAEAAHEHALEAGAQGVAGQLAVQDNAPQPDAGASAAQ